MVCPNGSLCDVVVCYDLSLLNHPPGLLINRVSILLVTVTLVFDYGMLYHMTHVPFPT